MACEANSSEAPKLGMGHSTHLEAESSLNEKGDQCPNEIAPLARPDVVFAPIGSCSNSKTALHQTKWVRHQQTNQLCVRPIGLCSNRPISIASDQVGCAAANQPSMCQSKAPQQQSFPAMRSTCFDMTSDVVRVCISSGG